MAILDRVWKSRHNIMSIISMLITLGLWGVGVYSFFLIIGIIVETHKNTEEILTILKGVS